MVSAQGCFVGTSCAAPLRWEDKMIGSTWETSLGRAVEAIYEAALEITKDEHKAQLYTKIILEGWLDEHEEPVESVQAA